MTNFQQKPEKFEVSETNQLFFVSDLHFFHKRICDFTERKKYTNTEQHNQWLIQQLNKTIPVATDTVTPITLHLGDMFFSCTNEEAINVLSQLNGDWWFVLGNHCNVGKLETVINTVNQMKGTNHRVLGWYYRLNIVEKSDVKDKKDFKKLLILCHFPIESWDSMGRGSYHCYGHMHSMTIDHHSGQEMRTIPNRLDCGIDNAYKLYGKHKPFTWKEVKQFMKGSGFVYKEEQAR